jgi:hypothetical protein
MQMGESPEAILAAVTDPSFDSRYDRRQYGIVDLSPSAVGFTGASTLDYAGDVQGTVGVFTYSVQGNILTSRAVIDQARAAFEASGCDLADRLMRALEAGADGGEGDSRCTPDGIPSDGAFLQVDRPDEPRGTWLSLRIDDTEPESPLVLLRAEYDAWRADNPCPAPPTPDAGLDAGAAGDAGPVGTDAGFPRDSGRLDASRRLDAGPPAAGTDDGCGCIAAGRPAGEPRGGAGLVACAALAALWLVHRRRW